MSCRRICRELLWQARFGELGPGSAPHLEHLADCRSCRDELGFDRALVRQLRTALAARVEGVAPSPRAWEGVLARMETPEARPSRLRAWSTMLVARLRFGSAMAGATLAILVALNVEIVPVRPSDARYDAGALPSTQAPERPLRLADGFSQTTLAAPYAVVAEEGAEPDAPVTYAARGVWAQEPERLPVLGERVEPESVGQAQAPTAGPGQATSPRDAWQPLTVRLVPGDAVVLGEASPTTAHELRPSNEEPSPALEAGAPS
ncbi:MAG: hypothetical protein KY392_03530 [Chloroflexi bacterium]|nr:hypothetical protein [Chloroflexota bacterium]